MDLSNLTQEDIERMRAIVSHHDITSGKVASFDLNKPPQQGLVFKPFPKMIYHHKKRIYRIVDDEHQLEEQLAQGWDTKPYPMEPAPVEIELEPAAAAEAAAVQAQLKRKPEPEPAPEPEEDEHKKHFPPKKR